MIENQLTTIVPTTIPTNILPIILLRFGVISSSKNLYVGVIIHMTSISLTILNKVESNEL